VPKLERKESQSEARLLRNAMQFGVVVGRRGIQNCISFCWLLALMEFLFCSLRDECRVSWLMTAVTS
jgi:hypothetical protein